MTTSLVLQKKLKGILLAKEEETSQKCGSLRKNKFQERKVGTNKN